MSDLSAPTITINMQNAPTFSLISFDYREELGRPFEMTVVMSASSPGIQLNDTLGASLTVTVVPPYVPSTGIPQSAVRYFSGIISEIKQEGFPNRDGDCQYIVHVSPWIAMSKLYKGFNIFSSDNVSTILQDVFKKYCTPGSYEFDMNLHQTYEDIQLIQYAESDFDFVHRLMETFGITYYTKHTKTAHTIQFIDATSGYQPSFLGSSGSSGPTFNYTPVSAPLSQGNEIIDWNLAAKLIPPQATLYGYNYLSPRTLQILNQATSQTCQNYSALNSLGYYDYPETLSVDNTSIIAVVAELECLQNIYQGEGYILGMSCGYKFQVSQINDVTYVAVSTHLTINRDQVTTQSETIPEYTYLTKFTAIPSTTRYCNSKVTPPPPNPGLVNAVVVGSGGTTSPPDSNTPYIDSDSNGNVTVQFPWTTGGQVYSPSTSSATLTLRVSQFAAGYNRGSMFTPLPGDEVLVHLGNGNPNTAVVVGSLYNGFNTPAIPLNNASNPIYSYICDAAGNGICWNPTKGQESLSLSSPYKGGGQSGAYQIYG